MPEVGIELYRLIKVSGADRQEFLQGQLTQDVYQLADRGSMLAAWCNPRGRVIATLRLLALGDAIGLVIATDLAEAVCQRLAGFRFRAKVEFEIIDDNWQCTARQLRDELPLIPPARDVVSVSYVSDVPIAEYFGTPAGIAASASPGAGDLTELEWRQALIHAGVPVIGMANSEKFTPHMLNLDQLDAISFSKGCYTGQEIVARTQNLGTSKRRLMRFTSSTNSIDAGDKLSLDGKNVAEVVNSAAGDLLAVAPVALHGQTLVLKETTAEPAALPYTVA